MYSISENPWVFVVFWSLITCLTYRGNAHFMLMKPVWLGFKSLFLSAQIRCHDFCFHVRYATRQSYFCPPEGLDTLSAGRMRAADKRLQEVRPDYLLSEQSAAVAQIHTHIVRYVRDGIIAGLSNMFRASNTGGFSASGHDWTFFIVSRFGGKPRAIGWTETCSETGYWLSNGRPGTVVRLYK